MPIPLISCPLKDTHTLAQVKSPLQLPSLQRSLALWCAGSHQHIFTASATKSIHTIIHVAFLFTARLTAAAFLSVPGRQVVDLCCDLASETLMLMSMTEGGE